MPVAVDNGVRLAAVAEHHLGAAQLINDVLYLSVGNRIAMGLIVDGKPRRGAHDAAGDIGRLAVPGVDPATGQLQWQDEASAADVFARARAGEEVAKAELADFVERLSRSLALLIMAVDPSKVVIGGGLSRARRARARVPPLVGGDLWSRRHDGAAHHSTHRPRRVNPPPGGVGRFGGHAEWGIKVCARRASKSAFFVV